MKGHLTLRCMPHNQHPLPRNPTPEQIETIAAKLVGEAVRCRSPRRTAAALIRWRYAPALAPEALCRLKETVSAQLQDVSGDLQEGALDYLWLTVEEAAPHLRITPATLRKRLHRRESRQDLGWPMWDDHQWLIPRAAIDPATRPRFLAELPDDEPYPPPPFADR